MVEKVEKKKTINKNIMMATGRRKTSIARVKLTKGKGLIIVNSKPLEEYFPAGNYVMIVTQPLKIIDFKNDYDFHINVYGGGLTGQAGAIRHAIARVLNKFDEKNHKSFSFFP